MANKIVEGLWDCPYCGSKAIPGLTKHCPNCGHPQDTGTKFYMGERIKYLDSDMAEKYGKGPDWTCAYCGSLNRYHYKFCTNCGGPKDETTGNYFDNQKKMEEKAAKKNAPPEPVNNNKNSGGFLKRFFPILLIIILASLIFGFFSKPKNANVQITDKSWERSVEVEGMQTVQQDDWSVPDGGRVYDEKQEIHHYDQVVDHYERRSREVAEQVYDGEDYHTSYEDNGDGTFSEVTSSTPRYRTEYHTEYYDEPIYRDEPVYRTKYYYELDIWPVVRTETSSGKADDPYWPDLNLGENEREGASTETYTIAMEDLKKGKDLGEFTLPQAEWEQLKIGESIEVTYKKTKITKINGQEVD